MNARVYVLSFSFGLGLGTTSMHTSNPFAEVMQLAAAGHHLEHVTIKSVSSSDTEQNLVISEKTREFFLDATGIDIYGESDDYGWDFDDVDEQNWQFLEWS